MAVRLLDMRRASILFLCLVFKSTNTDGCRNSNTTLHFPESVSRSFSFQTNYSGNRSIWHYITAASSHVFKQQNIIYSASTKHHNVLVVVIFNTSTAPAAAEFMDNVSRLIPHAQYVNVMLNETTSSDMDLDLIINIFLSNINNINTVALFLESMSSVVSLLTAVESREELKLSGVMHTTEWMIVCSQHKGILSDLQKYQTGVDFITLIFQCCLEVACIAQKSRTETLIVRAQVFSNVGLCLRGKYNADEALDMPEELRTKGKIRSTAIIFLSSQKSILSGMKLNTALLEGNFPRLAETTFNGNVSTVKGYSVRINELLAEAMGFSYNFVSTSDGEYYGKGESSENATGLTGMLARRQAAFTTMPLSRTDDRLKVIDFVPVVIMIDTVHIIYRLSKRENDIDLIFINIFKPQFLYTLLGPALVLAIIGGLVHISTRSCSEPFPGPLSWFGARILLSYSEHICFHSSGIYPGQTGRVLRGTWSVFWLIICSSYAAFLVTTFATKPQELSITTLQQVADDKDFKIGTAITASAFINLLRTSTNTAVQEVWGKLLRMNETDPTTFHHDNIFHAEKVVKGHYIFLSGFCITMNLCDDIFADHLEEIRVYAMSITGLLDTTYVATPKDIFYGDSLQKVLLDFEETGILQHLRNCYFKRKLDNQMVGSKLMKRNLAVTLSRIQLPIYTALVGVSVSGACLGIEIVYNRWRKRKCITDVG